MTGTSRSNEPNGDIGSVYRMREGARQFPSIGGV